MAELIRVQKLIAQGGFCSRRKAEEYIKKGLVKVNDVVVTIGSKATINDQITINNMVVNIVQPNFIYYLLNKPKNVITTTKDTHNRKSVIDLIDTNNRVVPVGRLDRDTTGALLLTNDLEMVNKLTHPKYEIKRTYRARIEKALTLKEFKEINSGIIVNGKMSHQIVDQVEEKSYLVTLTVGSYHHVKRLFEALGHKVLTLKRIAFANLTVDKIPSGSYRELKIKELKDLKNIIKTQENKLCLKE